MSKKSGATFKRADKQSEAFHFGLEQLRTVDAATADDEEPAAVAHDDGHSGSEVTPGLGHRAGARERGDRRLNVVRRAHPTGPESVTQIGMP